jgi:hypothetical protein
VGELGREVREACEEAGEGTGASAGAGMRRGGGGEGVGASTGAGAGAGMRRGGGGEGVGAISACLGFFFRLGALTGDGATSESESESGIASRPSNGTSGSWRAIASRALRAVKCKSVFYI